jgi:hypothetical protein
MSPRLQPLGNVATPILYETILVRKHGMLELLLRTIESSVATHTDLSRAVADPKRPLASFIRCIDFCLEYPADPLEDRAYASLTSLLRHSKNCRVITFRCPQDWPLPSSPVPSIINISASIRHCDISWNDIAWNLETDMIIDLLSGLGMPGILETLALRCPKWPREYPRLQELQVSFPKLHTLLFERNLSCVIQSATNWALSSIRRIVCNSRPLEHDDCTFFERHGSSLASFETIKMERFPSSIILPLCPNLRYLRVSVRAIAACFPRLPELAELYMEAVLFHGNPLHYWIDDHQYSS